MTSEALEKAKKMMAEQRGHCAHAVLTSLAERASSGEIDFDMMNLAIFTFDLFFDANPAQT